jgi:catechol 2,3-dioxygenase-like lactoylglutathione lyase family enzyme
MAELEHVNITVPDADATAAVLCDLFEWQVRWKGAAKNDGLSVHVGSAASYVALYTPGATAPGRDDSYATTGAMNHIGITVADIDATEARVRAAGYTTHSHGDYEPGRRFYFDDANGVEIEVVCYA